jgi:hypothetical protein
MAERALVEKKLEASFELANRLAQLRAPLLAAYWELAEESGSWDLQLVPTSRDEEMALIKVATEVLVEPPYRSVFSLLDISVDARQIERARAIAAYMRRPEDIGSRFDTTFTGGEYFEAFIVVYLAPELQRHLSVA